MFIELVANPIPNTIADSTPWNLANNTSSSSILSKFPAWKTANYFNIRHDANSFCFLNCWIAFMLELVQAGIPLNALDKIIRNHSDSQNPQPMPPPELTHLLPRAANPSSTVWKNFRHCLFAKSNVLCISKIVVGSHVNYILYHFSCISIF